MGLEVKNPGFEDKHEGVLSRLRKSTKGLAKALALTAALSVGYDNFSNSAEKKYSPANISEAVQLVKGRDKFYEDHLIKWLTDDPGSVISVCHAIIPKLRNPEKFFAIAAQRDPRMTILYAEDLKELSNSDRILQTAAESLVNSGKAGDLIMSYHRFSDYPSAEKILETAAPKASEQDPSIVLDYARFFTGKKYAQEVLDSAIKNDPQSAIRHASQFQKHHEDDILRIAGGPGGESARQHESDKIIANSLKNSQDSLVKIVNDLNETKYSLGIKTKMSLLLQDFLDKKISFEEMAEITNDDSRMFSALIDLSEQPNPIGKKAIEKELKNICLKEVLEINRLHEQTDSVRFKSIDGLNYRHLYKLMVYGEEEIFTSSFNSIFNRMLKDMKDRNIVGNELIENMRFNKFRNFVKMCAGFNRLNDFLATMDPEAKNDFLAGFVQNIEREPDMLSQAVAIADTFGSLSDRKILEKLEKVVASEYERTSLEGHKKGQAVYGLLSGMFEGKSALGEDWLQRVIEKYKLPHLEKISSRDLFNPDGTNIQQYFFYGDADGKSSFESFLNEYKGQGWKIENKKNYVEIRSTRPGKRIEIFANFPDKDDGVADIQKELEKRKVESIVIVHRGHSYHVQDTIRRIPDITRIVSLGSCGGYSNLDAILKGAPKAHIISTKGTGTKLVNDPLLKMLNEEILRGKDIQWADFWKKAENRLGRHKEFSDYVAPHKNLGVLFIKAYNEIIKQGKGKIKQK